MDWTHVREVVESSVKWSSVVAGVWVRVRFNRVLSKIEFYLETVSTSCVDFPREV